MFPRRTRLVLAAGATTSLLLAGCGGASSETSADAPGAGGAAPAAVDVLLDWAPNPDHVALFTAEHTGAYADAGLEVEFTTPSNTADAAREVSLGRVDLAVSYEPDILIATEQGLDVQSVAALVPTSLTSLITKEGSGITSGADLEGRTVGHSGLASSEVTVDFVARDAGLDPESVTQVNVQQSLNQALLTDQVDAIFGGYRNIEAIELAARTDVVVMPVTELGVPDYAELVLIANPTRLADDEAYAERVRAFLAATAEGQEQAVADHDLAIESLKPRTGSAYDDEILASMVDATLEILPADDFGTQDPADWATYATWMHDNGLVESEVDGASATTNAFLPAGGR